MYGDKNESLIPVIKNTQCLFIIINLSSLLVNGLIVYMYPDMYYSCIKLHECHKLAVHVLNVPGMVYIKNHWFVFAFIEKVKLLLCCNYTIREEQ